MSGHSKWEPLSVQRLKAAMQDQPAPRFPAGETEYEVEILRRRIKVMRDLFWQIYMLTGADPDMDDPNGPCPPEGVYTPDVPELAVDAVRELRHECDEAMAEATAIDRTALIQRIR
jgi:hypothetical protein